jgi:hypothetical protein
MAPNPQTDQSIVTAAKRRAEELQEWLVLNAPECRKEQKHLDKGTAERAYWNFGYLSALQDLLRLMSSKRQP